MLVIYTKNVTLCKRHRNDAFDRMPAIDDKSDSIIDCRRGESPYAEGRKQHCYYLLNRMRESWWLTKSSPGGTRHHTSTKHI